MWYSDFVQIWNYFVDPEFKKKHKLCQEGSFLCTLKVDENWCL